MVQEERVNGGVLLPNLRQLSPGFIFIFGIPSMPHFQGFGFTGAG